MERRTPLTRRTPLRRTTPLARSATQPRPAAAARLAGKHRRTRDSGPTRTVRELVFARDRGRCVRCGIRVDRSPHGWSIQHRIARGAGGRRNPQAAARVNGPANLLLLCGTATTGCHGWCENEQRQAAKDRGFVIPVNADVQPATVPVLTWHGWVLFDTDGGWAKTTAPRADDDAPQQTGEAA